jgi:guanine deaminase
MTDKELLARAVALATGNAAAGQMPFGALVVRDGQVLGTDVEVPGAAEPFERYLA